MHQEYQVHQPKNKNYPSQKPKTPNVNMYFFCQRAIFGASLRTLGVEYPGLKTQTRVSKNKLFNIKAVKMYLALIFLL